MSSEPRVPDGVTDGPSPEVNDLLARIGLVDHHTHSIVGGPIARADYLFMLDESDKPEAAGLAGLETQVGFAVRRWCAPLLKMRASEPEETFLERRLAMTNDAAAARLLPMAGFERLIVETGFRGERLVGPDELGRLASARVSTVVRLETVAESLALGGIGAGRFADAVVGAVADSLSAGAIGLKSIAAYRHGLDLDPSRPERAAVERAAGAWLRTVEETGSARITDPVLLRLLLWTAVDTGRPLQIHTGYGDTDLDLRRADPIHLTDFIRATEGRLPILLLHTYPFQRNAGYLAQMFANVYLDVGLAINYVGAQSPQVIAESLELAPFGKLLFSSDAWGLPELHLVGSLLFRRGMSRVVGEWVARGDWSLADAERVVRRIAGENARRVYGLPAPD
jgi:predicted TIM-barrel fold metal-dependent hydrolase